MISEFFGLLGLSCFHFLSFWPFGLWFFLAFISFHFGLFGLHFVSFWAFRGAISFHSVFFSCVFLSFGFFWFLLSLQFGLFFDGSPDLWTWQRFWRHVRDGQPRPTRVERCCRGVPRPGPRLTQGGVVCRPPTDGGRSPGGHLANNKSVTVLRCNPSRKVAMSYTALPALARHFFYLQRNLSWRPPGKPPAAISCSGFRVVAASVQEPKLQTQAESFFSSNKHMDYNTG